MLVIARERQVEIQFWPK